MSDKPFTDWKPYLVPKKYKDNYDRIFKSRVVGSRQGGIKPIMLELNKLTSLCYATDELLKVKKKCLKN